MNITFIILGVIIFIFVVLLIFYYNKFSYMNLKINKAEIEINELLNKKKVLLLDCVPIITKEVNIEEFLDDVENINEQINSFDLNKLLIDGYKELFKVIDENDKLTKSDKLIGIVDELNDTQEDITGLIKYYNDNIVGYNQLVKSFPSMIFAFILRNKEKDYYDEKREIYDIKNETYEENDYPEAYRNINIVKKINEEDKIEEEKQDETQKQVKSKEQEKIENTKNIKEEIKKLYNTANYNLTYENKVDNDTDLDDIFDEVKEVVEKNKKEEKQDEIKDEIEGKNEEINDTKDDDSNLIENEINEMTKEIEVKEEKKKTKTRKKKIEKDK